MGLRVALLDYFVNLNRELKNPKVIEIAIYERTERSALTDGLTGLFNHAYFLQALRREMQRCKRHGLKLVAGDVRPRRLQEASTTATATSRATAC